MKNLNSTKSEVATAASSKYATMKCADETIILGRAISSYYEKFPFRPTPSDFKKWINSLPEKEFSPYRYMSFEKCRRIMLFRIFFYDSQPISLQDYLKSVLDDKTYKFYIEKKGNAKLVW